MDTHDTLEDVLAGILEDDEMDDDDEDEDESPDCDDDKENNGNQANGTTLVPA